MNRNRKTLLAAMTLMLVGSIIAIRAGAAVPKPAGQVDWATLGWSEFNLKQVEKLTRNQDADPISAYLGFNAISKSKNANAPTPAQKKWLEAASFKLEPQAKELLRKDFKQAADANDLRGCLISLAIAREVETNMLGNVAGVVAGIKSRVVAGKLGKEFLPLWKVEPSVGRYLDGTYSEGGGLFGRFSLTAKAGSRLLRVTTRIQNLSAAPDPPYIRCILNPLYRYVTRGNLGRNETDKPQRLAHSQFAFLITPGGDWISCGHVVEGFSVLRGDYSTFRSPDGSGYMEFSGQFVSQDRAFGADMIFSVPEGVEDFRFVFLGSTPVAVKIEK